MPYLPREIAEHTREELAVPQDFGAVTGAVAAGHISATPGAVRRVGDCDRQYPHSRRVEHSLHSYRASVQVEFGCHANRASRNGAHAIAADHSLRTSGRMDSGCATTTGIDQSRFSAHFARRVARSGGAARCDLSCGARVDFSRALLRLSFLSTVGAGVRAIVQEFPPILRLHA
jgi:hypothetical protein